MTRINCVPVQELTDAHLGAEYRELPRVFGLVRAAIKRGERPNDPRYPRDYTLGSGHVLFFYPRLAWVQDRYDQIVSECFVRERAVRFTECDTHGIGHEWFGAWQPRDLDFAINRARIAARLRGDPK